MSAAKPRAASVPLRPPIEVANEEEEAGQRREEHRGLHRVHGFTLHPSMGGGKPPRGAGA
jgi:hypothetical protein